MMLNFDQLIRDSVPYRHPERKRKKDNKTIKRRSKNKAARKQRKRNR